MTSNGTANTAESKHYGEAALPSPDGRLLAVPGENNTVVVIDAARGEGAVGNLLRPPGRPLQACVWDHQGPGVVARWYFSRFGQH